MAPREDIEHTASRIKATGAGADRLARLIETQSILGILIVMN